MIINYHFQFMIKLWWRKLIETKSVFNSLAQYNAITMTLSLTMINVFIFIFKLDCFKFLKTYSTNTWKLSGMSMFSFLIKNNYKSGIGVGSHHGMIKSKPYTIP